MLNYQGVDADVVSSAIDRYATTTESQENTPSDHGTLETMSFTTSLLTGQQQLLTAPKSFRLIPFIVCLRHVIILCSR